jgi:hypothetical protein
MYKSTAVTLVSIDGPNAILPACYPELNPRLCGEKPVSNYLSASMIKMTHCH